jgi:excisionase family DNA binding protein
MDKRMQVNPRQLLTVEELADFLQIPQTTIYAWRHRRKGPDAIRVGRHLRFRITDIESWLDKQHD